MSTTMMQMVMQNIRGRLKQEMDERELSYEGLANKIGVPVIDVKTLIRQSPRYIKIATLLQISRYYLEHMKKTEEGLNVMLQAAPLAEIKVARPREELS